MLTQSEADSLMMVDKVPSDPGAVYPFPGEGETLIIPALSIDGKDSFLIDVNRGSIKFHKCTYQNRTRNIEILLRLDIGGPPHTNPDELVLSRGAIARVPCPHLHIYLEGWMDKYAIPAPAGEFPNLNDLYDTLFDFFAYCNFVSMPRLTKSMLA